MGKRHAAAAAGIAQAQVDEQVREATARREAAERERQLLSSYLGSKDQVEGTGRFGNAAPEVLKYTQRYSIDQRALNEILASGSQVKRQEDPFQGADNRVRGGLSLQDYSQGFATRANDLLAQAEAAARAGDFTAADQLYTQAQSIVGGISQVAQGAYNLGGGEESAAALRASSAEGRIVGRQLFAARELQDPNSATSTGLRGRLLDPALAAIDQGAQSALGEVEAGERDALGEILAGAQGALGQINQGTLQSVGEIDASEREAQKAIDENSRNAERAIASERSQIDGEIRQRGAGGGVGVNARAQLALQSRAASDAARQRADVYGNAAAQAAQVRSQAGRLRASIYDDDAAQRAEIEGTSAQLRAAIESDAAMQRAQIFTMQGAQRAQLTAQVSLYMNEFTKRMAEDSVRLSQEWVDGTAGVRDEFQAALDRFSIIGIELANQRSQMLAQVAEARRTEAKAKKAARRDEFVGFTTGLIPLTSVFGGGFKGTSAKPVQADVGGGGLEVDGPAFGAVAGPNGAESTTPLGESAGGGVGAGGGGVLGAIGKIFGFL